MLTKVEIKGFLEVKTGMHIGASDAFSAIGAIDSPVIRDSITKLPIIPGSSLKGKIRSLLAKKYNKNLNSDFNGDAPEILRLFGSSVKNESKASRLIFSDAKLLNMEEIKSYGLNSATEAKFENTINRLTSKANPRQIERVISGSKFPISIIYNVENEDEAIEDFTLLADGLKLLEYDYLGGHGSRGYGRVKLNELSLDVVVGSLEDDSIKLKCEEILNGV